MSEQELQPPAGWRIQQGASGWRCIQPDRKWSTNVFTASMGGAAKAVEAAIELEGRAMLRLEETERLCASLRRYFHGK